MRRDSWNTGARRARGDLAVTHARNVRVRGRCRRDAAVSTRRAAFVWVQCREHARSSHRFAVDETPVPLPPRHYLSTPVTTNALAGGRGGFASASKTPDTAAHVESASAGCGSAQCKILSVLRPIATSIAPSNRSGNGRFPQSSAHHSSTKSAMGIVPQRIVRTRCGARAPLCVRRR